MKSPYLLAQRIIPARPALRARSTPPRLRVSDPAHCAMTDFLQDPPLTLSENVSVEQAVDQMFRLGVRAFLVLRERCVVGLMTAAEAARLTPHHLRVADVMTPTDEVPAIGWDTLDEARVGDLIEIFDGSGVNHLVVLENHSATINCVRGLIHRERLDRQLRSPWSLRLGMM
jgi:DeoR family transcriptional regulator, catabolite repression regulator